ncbi:MAG: shikimate kinase [Vulcanimicrobiota bacterium]
MQIKKNIYLAGFMGTGKSTIGRELARFMGRKFIDMDKIIERNEGMSVNSIFEEKGEEHFREMELKVARELSRQTNRVVATGGGTLLNDQIRELFVQSGIIICLITNEEQLVSRLKRTDKRPLLKGYREELNKKVSQLLEERKNVYSGINIRIDTTNLTPQEAAHKIIDILKMKIRILDRLHDQYITIR